MSHSKLNQAIPPQSKQFIRVTVDSWDTHMGVLERYQRSSTHSPWQPVGEQLAIVIGEKGLAWPPGDVEVAAGASPVKREGDLRTPVGVYQVGPAFGFSEQPEMRISYQVLTKTTVGVDDLKSRYYNQIVDADQVKDRDWDSAEQMFTVPQYELGAVIQYNTANPRPGAGSCIFMHIWRGADVGTHGCVAMAREDLRTLLTWLDPEKHPVIGVFPKNENNPSNIFNP